MTSKCKYCGERVMKGDPFILDGNYPGLLDKIWARMYTYADDFENYGDVYHKACYVKHIRNLR